MKQPPIFDLLQKMRKALCRLFSDGSSFFFLSMIDSLNKKWGSRRVLEHSGILKSEEKKNKRKSNSFREELRISIFIVYMDRFVEMICV